MASRMSATEVEPHKRHSSGGCCTLTKASASAEMKQLSRTSDEYVQFPFLKEIDHEWKYDFSKEQLEDIYRMCATSFVHAAV